MNKWLLVGLAACGGRTAAPKGPSLQPRVDGESWYSAATSCGQGPYELDVPVANAKYGEEVELRMHTLHDVMFKVVVEVDGQPFQHASIGTRADNEKCVATVGERLAIARAGGGGGGGGGGTVATGDAAPPAQAVVAELVPAPVPTLSVSELQLRVPAGAHQVKVRLWSIDPNDLTGVEFGVLHVTYAPNVPEATYEAYLAKVRDDDNARLRADQERAEQEARARVVPAAPAPTVVVRVDPAAEARARRQAELDAERARREAALEAERARARAELEARRRREREAFCNAHADDRDCWGAGGRRIHDDLDAHQHERDAYCAAHHEDARCWSDDERGRIESAAHARVAAALRPPKQPDGPPPAALAETMPPKLSAHAEWRAGYWQWTEETWVWLAGMWRVPDSDIVAEQTTTAPQPPPPLQAEMPPPAPVRVAVWVPGFWQWSGSTWIWVAGSWQLRPDARAEWRPAAWQPRGRVHVLVPGGWIHR